MLVKWLKTFFIRSLARSFVHSYVRSFILSFICSFVHSFVRSFVRSLDPSFIYLFIQLKWRPPTRHVTDLPSSISRKLMWDLSNDSAGSNVCPTMTKGIEMLYSGTKKRQKDSTRSSESDTYSNTISCFFPLSTVPSGVRHRKLMLSGAPSNVSSLVHVKL